MQKWVLVAVSILALTGCTNNASSLHGDISTQAAIESAAWDRATDKVNTNCEKKSRGKESLADCWERQARAEVGPHVLYPDLFEQYISAAHALFSRKMHTETEQKHLFNAYSMAAAERANASLSAASAQDTAARQAWGSAILQTNQRMMQRNQSRPYVMCGNVGGGTAICR